MAKFTYHDTWNSAPSDEEKDDLTKFWLSEGALTSPDQARDRLRQVVLYARDAEGAVAGVGTAFAHTLPQIGQPLYYYRSFIGVRWRSTRLVYLLIKRAQKLLGEYAREHEWPCIGMLLELENKRFGEKGRMPVWPHLDLVYAGKSPRGLELRVHYFTGASLH